MSNLVVLPRWRRELILAPLTFHGVRYWNVKDPLTLRYYQLSEEERFLVDLLDGQHSLTDMQARFEERFAPRKVEREQLHAFIGLLHREGLTTTATTGQGNVLLERHRAGRRQLWRQLFTNVLAIRLPGIDPDAALTWLEPKVRGLLTWPALLMACGLVLSALLLIGTQGDEFLARLPQFQAFFQPTNLVYLAMVLAGCKILHELGHAIACKRFGGECRELGVLLLVFTPCLYCNVSDAWMLRNKWQRIAISAAGIGVELVLASLATWLWWFSQPGLFNSICLNVMFTCSVSTLLFNGNPLLRYDGYFILADLVERPNLRQQAQGALQAAARWCCGMPAQTGWLLSTRERWGLALYGVISLLYRWLLAIGIWLVIYRLLQPYRLELLAQGLAAWMLISLLAVPGWQMIHSLRQPSVSGRLNRPRMAMVGAGVAALLLLIGLVPLPRSISAPAVIEPDQAVGIHTAVAGVLTAGAELGHPVATGDTLAVLANHDLDRHVVRLSGQRDTQRLHVEHLRKLQGGRPRSGAADASSELPTALEALASLERQLDEALQNQARLRIVSPQAGTVLPPRVQPSQRTPEELPTWAGLALDQENRGCWLPSDAALCWIGSPHRVRASLVVDQADLGQVRVGQRVRILLDEYHTRELAGVVTEIARRELDATPPELAAKRLVPSDPFRGAEHPLGVYYLVSVELPELATAPPLWSSGRARIEAAPATLAWRLGDYLRRTFRLDL